LFLFIQKPANTYFGGVKYKSTPPINREYNMPPGSCQDHCQVLFHEFQCPLSHFAFILL
jgi:hypothetical protein